MRHEKRIVDALGLKPGMKVLDCGCGVGGPARNIARMSGAHVTGITISDYQVRYHCFPFRFRFHFSLCLFLSFSLSFIPGVFQPFEIVVVLLCSCMLPIRDFVQIKRGNEHCVRDKLDHLVKLVQGDFLKMPFADATFDAAYAIEATCHSPTLDAVYGEIFRVLKPGAKFCAYEWVKSASFNPNDPEDEKICDEINYSNGLPNMRHQDDVVPAGEKVGFRKVVSEDLVLSAEVRWYEKLLISRLRYWATDVLCRFLELIRYAPKGTSSVHKMLMQAGDSLVRSGLKVLNFVREYIRLRFYHFDIYFSMIVFFCCIDILSHLIYRVVSHPCFGWFLRSRKQLPRSCSRSLNPNPCQRF